MINSITLLYIWYYHNMTNAAFPKLDFNKNVIFAKLAMLRRGMLPAGLMIMSVRELAVSACEVGEISP